MVRILALHKTPANPERYEKYFRDVHVPIALRIPGVQRIRFGKVSGGTGGQDAPYFLVSDVYFKDMNALQAALDSPQMEASLADLRNFTDPADVTIIFTDVEDVSPTP